MSKREFRRRRDVLKSVGAIGVGTAGLGQVQSVAAAEGDSWYAVGESAEKWDSFYEQYYREKVSTGLVTIDEDFSGSVHHLVFDFSSHGVVVEESSDEFILADEYEANDCWAPRGDDRFVDEHGLTVGVDSGFNTYISSNGDDGYIHPPTCEADMKTANKVGSAVVDLAVTGLNSMTASAAMGTWDLYSALTQDTIDTNDYLYTYPNGVPRGGTGAKITVQWGTTGDPDAISGVVPIRGVFGDAECGFDVYVDGDSYTVNPVDNIYYH